MSQRIQMKYTYNFVKLELQLISEKLQWVAIILLLMQLKFYFHLNPGT